MRDDAARKRAERAAKAQKNEAEKKKNEVEKEQKAVLKKAKEAEEAGARAGLIIVSSVVGHVPMPFFATLT